MGLIWTTRRVGKTLAVLGIRYLSQQKSTVRINRINDGWRVGNTVTGEYYDFPSFPQSIHIAHIGNGYAEFLGDKYQLDGFVEVEEGDHVVDVGPYVGAFIVYVQERAKKISALEPSPDTARLLESRWRDHPSIDIMNLAAWNQPKSLEFQLGPDASDNSVINIDKGEQVGTVTVNAVRLDSLFDHIDFLKLEAEGAEPEVLEGASGCHIEKVAVDASPERKGDSTVEQVRELLEEQGYEISVDGDMVFGWSQR
jgi:FkbM family methyltransferase